MKKIKNDVAFIFIISLIASVATITLVSIFDYMLGVALTWEDRGLFFLFLMVMYLSVSTFVWRTS